MDCPVSGGCHRAATGNISIFAGGSREAFERALPVLSILGHQILHTGPIGSASMLKVLTNYLCTVHLVALAEALTTAKVMGLDMNTTYEGIRISSGNSFVHETESQVILNGSRDIGFTMDLVIKDVGLFDQLAADHQVPLELSPLVLKIFKDAAAAYGPRENSPNIIRRYEEPCGVKVLGTGFPGDDGRRPAEGSPVSRSCPARIADSAENHRPAAVQEHAVLGREPHGSRQRASFRIAPGGHQHLRRVRSGPRARRSAR